MQPFRLEVIRWIDAKSPPVKAFTTDSPTHLSVNPLSVNRITPHYGHEDESVVYIAGHDGGVYEGLVIKCRYEDAVARWQNALA